MGTSFSNLSFLICLTVSDWINILTLAVNSMLGFWIVKTIQNKLTNKRILKDHFINEIKDVRIEYKNFLNTYYSNTAHPKNVIPWFKLMNIKISDLMNYLLVNYHIDQDRLRPYQIDLQELVTNQEDFISNYNKNKVIVSEGTKNQLIKFQQTHNKLFNDLIIAINNF